VREGSRVIPGSSTIHFDEISKKRIFESIDQSRTTKKMLKEKYMILKNRLGQVPTILDFYEYGEIDPMLFINYSRTYDQFVRSIDSDYTISFTKHEEAVLEFISSVLVNGKRPHELLMLRMLMKYSEIDEKRVQNELQVLGDFYNEADYQSAMNVLTKKFMNTQSEKKKYASVTFIEEKISGASMARRAESFYKNMLHDNFTRELENLIEYGLRRYQDMYRDHDENHLVLYQKYSRKDVCRILNWEKDDSSTIYGYRIKYNTCPIFVTYEKKEDIANSTKYEDQFIDQQIFSWMTRSKVSIDSPESQQLIHYQENNLKIYLFIKKSDGEGTDFYYMGKVKPVHWEETVIENDRGQKLPIMNFQLMLEHSVRNDIYEYFTK
jgi:hypothetical protein